jgi:large subunit ribosomal protein L18
LATKNIEKVRKRRKLRVRKKVMGTAARPRLAVYRSLSHIYVQAIDDVSGMTIAEASTLTADRSSLSGINKTRAARTVGMLVAERLQEKGISQAVFDRSRFLYHGRVRSLADGAREAGLKF